MESLVHELFLQWRIKILFFNTIHYPFILIVKFKTIKACGYIVLVPIYVGYLLNCC